MTPHDAIRLGLGGLFFFLVGRLMFRNCDAQGLTSLAGAMFVCTGYAAVLVAIAFFIFTS